MSDLVFIHKQFPKALKEKDIVAFYKKIAFNYTFLHEEIFEGAVEFAQEKNIKDIYGRTISQALEIYNEKNKCVKCENCLRLFEDEILE